MNEELIKPENIVYKRTDGLLPQDFHYCPGCGHGTVHKVLMEVMEEMGVTNNAIGVAPVGCSVFAYHYLNVDMQQAPHGRACAFATGMKRTLPDRIVFTYQGDGDLAAIGTAETIHAASRGEKILVIFINNGIYGMTSGQMAPTSLPGMKTTTSPYGRDVATMGHPLIMSNLLKEMPGVAYLTRQSVHKMANVKKLKQAFKKAIEYQQQELGFCMVEVVTNCPSNLKTTAVKANEFVDKEMIPFYPLGDIKVPNAS
ncbi:MAG: thiamine pyrophosphate-dependent enzyme [Bacteroidetes bacterium]|nr:thiamine pyrophosphate-dependent enzyme [Bacteroidota bacterium]